MSDLERLEQLHALKEKGIISQQDFDTQKEAFLKTSLPTENKSQIVYCVLAFFLGGLGIHNFYAGRWKRGITQLLMTVLSPLTLFLSYFIAFFWSVINIFAIHTDGQGKEFNPSPTAKWLCGILKICGFIWGIFLAGITILGITAGAVTGYTNTMRTYYVDQVLDYASKVSQLAKMDNEEERVLSADCSKVWGITPPVLATAKCEARGDGTVIFSGIKADLKEELLKKGGKQDSAGNLYFQF